MMGFKPFHRGKKSLIHNTSVDFMEAVSEYMKYPWVQLIFLNTVLDVLPLLWRVMTDRKLVGKRDGAWSEKDNDRLYPSIDPHHHHHLKRPLCFFSNCVHNSCVWWSPFSGRQLLQCEGKHFSYTQNSLPIRETKAFSVHYSCFAGLVCGLITVVSSPAAPPPLAVHLQS